MVRKVYPAGNPTTPDSAAVALPAELLAVLQVQVGEEVVVELDAAERRLVITPSALSPAANSTQDGVDAEFARQVAEFIEAYRPALTALAR